MSLNLLLKGQLRYLNEFYEVTAISGAGPNLEEVQKREGVAIHIVEMERDIAPVKDLIALLKLYRYFKKEKPDIVHSITPKAGLLSMLAAKFAGVPIRIHTFTGLIFPSKTGILQQILIHMDRILCWSATTVIPEGNGVKSDLIHYKITNKPLRVLANGNVNGIDVSYFNQENIVPEHTDKLRQELKIDKSDFIFIFVGRLVGDKGINELVAAFKEIQKEYLQVKLLLVGPLEIDLDTLLPETLQEMEQNAAIRSAGFQDDVRSYFAIADALVFPSYREGFPNVVLQAGAMELPCIVTNINGCNEIIEHENNGLIIPVKNDKALKDAMALLVKDPVLFRRLIGGTRDKIVGKYDQKYIWEAILAEYHRAEGGVAKQP